ncbi:MAG: efflux RND transporter permease subunit, partial [Candidatus Heimdallarchaeota archaeon]|nr:efflux RND transporter permease subunit [Candidatus Heimdallarchaeota archaeon]
MRKFFENIVDYPYAIIILIAFLSAFGLFILQNKISVEREPDITVPYIMINILYPGASPDEVESKITRKIEDKLKGLKNLDYIESMSYDGGLKINMKFIGNEEIADAKREVEDIINLVKPEFPLDAEEPFVESRSFDDTPILLVSLTNSADTPDLDVLKTYADKLKSKLEEIEEVSYIDYYGDLEHEIHIEVDPLLAEAYGFTIDEIARIIQSEHQNYPVGEFLSERKSLLIKTQSEFQDLASIQRLKIKRPDGSEVSLSQIAKIVSSIKKQSSFSRFNSKPSITLIIKGQDKINVLQVVDSLQKKINLFKQDLPSSIEINTIQDAGSDIKLMIKQLGSSALYGALFVFILLVVMIGIRNAVLVGFAIPFTILFGITFLYLFDFS